MFFEVFKNFHKKHKKHKKNFYDSYVSYVFKKKIERGYENKISYFLYY